MLTEISGDLLDVRNGIICHQVNYYGVMGGGVAAAIADKLLSAEQYAAYSDYCKQAGRTALGNVQFLVCAPGLVVANMFCQDEALARTGGDFCITDYDLMHACFKRVRDLAQVTGLTVYAPRNIGCGIAGGDWGTVRQIIQDVFGDSSVEMVIVSREAENGRAQELHSRDARPV